MSVSSLSRVIHINFQTNTKDFQSHGKTVQRISLTHEKMYAIDCSVRRVLQDLINVLGHFSVISQPWNFYKVEFTDSSSAAKTARKITQNTSIFRLITRS